MPNESLRLTLSANKWPFGFALQVMWPPLVVRQNFIDHGAIDIHLVFYSSLGLIALVVALLFCLRRLRMIRLSCSLLCTIGFICMGSSSTALTLDLFAGSTAVAAFGSSIGGIGAMVSMLAWGSFFKDLPLKQSMSYILVSFIIWFFLQPIFFLFFPFANTFVLLIIAAGGPFCLYRAHNCQLRKAAGETADKQPHVEPDLSAREIIEKSGDGPSRKKVAPRFLWLSIAFSTYSFLLTLRSPINYDSSGMAVAIFSYTALLVALGIYWYLLVRRSSLPLVRLFQILIAVFAVGFFLQPFASGSAADSIATVFMIATGLIYLLVWMAVIDIAHSSKVHPFVVVGIWGACYGCPRILHFGIEVLMVQQGQDFDATLMSSFIALFCLCICFFLLSYHQKGARPFFCEIGQNDSLIIDSVASPIPLAELAIKHSLTDREAEVFYLACEGHSRRYIAEHLYLSENTVKSHLKRIYVKTGVHSKYDLEKVIWAEKEKEKEKANNTIL